MARQTKTTDSHSAAFKEAQGMAEAAESLADFQKTCKALTECALICAGGAPFGFELDKLARELFDSVANVVIRRDRGFDCAIPQEPKTISDVDAMALTNIACPLFAAIKKYKGLAIKAETLDDLRKTGDALASFMALYLPSPQAARADVNALLQGMDGGCGGCPKAVGRGPSMPRCCGLDALDCAKTLFVAATERIEKNCQEAANG